MESLLAKGSSTFHRLVALYTCKSDGILVQCTNEVLREHWSTFQALREDAASASEPPTAKHLKLPFEAYSDRDGSNDASAAASGAYLERKHVDETFTTGIIIRTPEHGSFEPLDEYFLDLVLRSTEASVPAPNMDPTADTNDDIIEKIVDLFDKTIRNITPDDQWPDGGREFFTERVRHFTRRDIKIEFALPAFPCKSSNPNKVGGNLPDKGEMLALTTLHEFVQDIEHLYAPGATVLIVSDGHVFSDCIGVDDGMVDEYSKALHEMNDTLKTAFEDDGRQRIRFQSLTEMLHLDGDDAGPELADKLGLDIITHHIEQVKINDDAELCRRLLMQGFKAETDQLRGRIDDEDPKILRLYRGFSRFMLEDLEKNPYTSDLSKSKRRKLSSKVAFEMIERNQAYSNLVEMIFPYHVRLSIHAHNNSGPKFGINLMPAHVRATNTLPPDGKNAESCDLLHVPTPWHGCVVEIAGDGHMYLAKVEQVREAIQEEKVIAAWVEPAVEDTDIVVDQIARKGSKGSTDTGSSDGAVSIDAGSSDSGSDTVPTAAHFTLIPKEKQYVI